MAYEQEMKQGYITIEGGHRIGIAGQVIMEQNGVRNFRYISSVNIRVAHQVRGCADAVMPYLMSQDNVYSTLIIAPIPPSMLRISTIVIYVQLMAVSTLMSSDIFLMTYGKYTCINFCQFVAPSVDIV